MILRGYLVWENKRRDREPVTQEGVDDRDLNMLDMTDKEMRTFRYVY